MKVFKTVLTKTKIAKLVQTGYFSVITRNELIKAFRAFNHFVFFYSKVKTELIPHIFRYNKLKLVFRDFFVTTGAYFDAENIITSFFFYIARKTNFAYFVLTVNK
jgi:hypothetical protein